MKSVLISIQPKWCELIANGKKTIEVRKTKPNLKTPFKCYIYETKGLYKGSGGCLFQGKGKVIGEFICDSITGLKADNCIQAYYNNNTKETCIDDIDIIIYAGGKMLYYWHISNLKIYDKPKELSKFGLSRPPQSWCYVEERINPIKSFEIGEYNNDR